MRALQATSFHLSCPGGDTAPLRQDTPDELLDEHRLDRLVAMQRVLMPSRNVLLVNRSSLDNAIEAVGEACQRWGGAAYLLVPCARGARELPDDYRLLDDALIDELWTRDVVEEFSFRGTDRRVHRWTIEHFLLGTLYSSRYNRDDWGSVRDALPARNDPWFVSYLAALGRLPDRPRERLLEVYHFVADLDWNQMFPFTAQAVDSPDAADLLARLRDPTTRSPASLSMALLGVAPARRAADIPSPAVLPQEGHTAGELGPNIVVSTSRPASVTCARYGTFGLRTAFRMGSRSACLTATTCLRRLTPGPPSSLTSCGDCATTGWLW